MDDILCLGLRLLGVLLLTISLILSNDSLLLPPTISTVTSIITQMTLQLLFFVTTSPSNFKNRLLEHSIRRAMTGAGAGGLGGTGQVVKPQISLRSFWGLLPFLFVWYFLLPKFLVGEHQNKSIFSISLETLAIQSKFYNIYYYYY